MQLEVSYKNGTSDSFDEGQLDCSGLTVKGHAASLITAWGKGDVGVYKIDLYNAVLLGEVVSVQVLK